MHLLPNEQNSPAARAYFSARVVGVRAKIPPGLRLVEQEQPGGNFVLRPPYTAGPGNREEWWPGAHIGWVSENPRREMESWADGAALDGILWRFVKLADAPNDRIFAFATRFG